MAWFRRKQKGIQTPTKDKMDMPKGLWYKTPSGKIVDTQELKANFYVSPEDDYHVRIGSEAYFEILFDGAQYEEHFAKLEARDPLNFKDTKRYTDRLKASRKQTGLHDALRTASGLCSGNPLIVAAMDFSFIGGSMGSVVGEKIARSVDYALEHTTPLMIISKSGGARMMEAAFSLMQMAKTTAKLAELAEAQIPYISLLTDPTTGGVTASFAMLGDINIAEPGALIGFAGPRVIKETIGRELPKGFQTAEFLLEHGFIDFIVHRKHLKDRVSQFLELIYLHPKK